MVRKDLDIGDLMFGYLELFKKQGRFTSVLVKEDVSRIVEGVQEVNAYKWPIRGIYAYDSITFQHSMFVTMGAIYFGKAMGLDNYDMVDLAINGLIHDYGKIYVPKAIITAPRKLTDTEFELIKTHPNYIDTLSIPEEYKVLGKFHHERVDGSGYPNKEFYIPLVGRMGAVIDVFEALAADRPYRKSLDNKDIEKIMDKGVGTQFDKNVYLEFKKILVL